MNNNKHNTKMKKKNTKKMKTQIQRVPDYEWTKSKT